MVETKIMAVYSRKNSVQRILNETGLGWDSVVFDERGINGGGDAWWNAKRAWTMDLGNASHRLVLQDDIHVCDDFLEAVNVCVERFPESVWTFYNSREITMQDKTDTPFMRLRGCGVGGPALLMPTKLILPMIRWSDLIFGEDYKHDDGRIAWFCAYHSIPVMCTIPSTVCLLRIKSTLRGHSTAFRQGDSFSQTWDKKAFLNSKYNVTKLSTDYVWLKEGHPQYDCAMQMKREAIKRERSW